MPNQRLQRRSRFDETAAGAWTLADRLDAWFDGSAICFIAVGSHGDPLDLGEEEVLALIEKLQQCLTEAKK